MSDPATKKRNHLLIAGTGRAGTSFIVRYLTELGLDTTLSRAGAAAFWDDNANAGLEEKPILDTAGWPYVVKTPWLYQFVDELLADESVTVDAVIMPVRSLQEAAASRVIIELRAIHATHPWLAESDSARSEWGMTAGGCLMPLEPLDQARLLAVGFYDLVERLVRADVPVIFPAFPRLAQDADYFFGKLAPFLPGVSAAQARLVHARLAEPDKVRVGDELQSAAIRRGARVPDAGPDLAALNDVALRRELARVRGELATAQRDASTVASAAEQSSAEADRARAEAEEAKADAIRAATIADQAKAREQDLRRRDEFLLALEADLARARAELAAETIKASSAGNDAQVAQQHAQELRRRNDILAGEVRRLAGEADALRALRAQALEAEGLRADVRRLVAERDMILHSTSWSLTAPIRYFGMRLPATARSPIRGIFRVFGGSRSR